MPWERYSPRRVILLTKMICDPKEWQMRLEVWAELEALLEKGAQLRELVIQVSKLVVGNGDGLS